MNGLQNYLDNINKSIEEEKEKIKQLIVKQLELQLDANVLKDFEIAYQYNLSNGNMHVSLRNELLKPIYLVAFKDERYKIKSYHTCDLSFGSLSEAIRIAYTKF